MIVLPKSFPISNWKQRIFFPFVIVGLSFLQLLVLLHLPSSLSPSITLSLHCSLPPSLSPSIALSLSVLQCSGHADTHHTSCTKDNHQTQLCFMFFCKSSLHVHMHKYTKQRSFPHRRSSANTTTLTPPLFRIASMTSRN